MNELLTKTHVLESAKNGQLLQNTAFSNVKKLKNVEIPKTTAEYKPLPKTTVSNTAKKWYLLRNIKVLKAQNLRKPEIKETCTTLLLVSLLATCQPSYAIAPHYQPLNNHSFNYVDVVAVNGNNGRQERQNLSVSVKHHTIVDVFFCLSFASLPIMGELRLAIALLALWWGGHRNKPLRANTVCRVTAVLNLPAALILGRINKTSLPVRKVQ